MREFVGIRALLPLDEAWLNLKHVTEQRLDKAIFKVINAYNRFALSRYWGSGKSASADGTKWNMYERNLLSEYHIDTADTAGSATITSPTSTSHCLATSSRAAFTRPSISSTA